MRSRAFLAAALILSILPASPSLAAGAIVRDGGTVEVAGIAYRLDGIDAPEVDQMCIDDHADPWACGVEARDHLAGLIGSHQVRCQDLGVGTTYKKRHIGICTVEGESTSLNQLLVAQGFALNFEPYARGRFKADETEARNRRRGLWKGCFAAPQDFRWGKKDGALFGDSCRADKDREIRAALFPDDLAMPAAAASRPVLRCAPASPARSVSTICRAAAAILRSPGPTAGSVPKKMPRQPGSEGLIIAGASCNKTVVEQN